MSHRVLRLAALGSLALATFAGAARAQSPAFEIRGQKHGTSFSVSFGGHSKPSYFERRQVWVPGRYEVRCERVWVPGCSRQEWQPAQYEWRYDHCGRPIRVCVNVGRWITVSDPGRYETREYREWVPGHWRHC